MSDPRSPSGGTSFDAGIGLDLDRLDALLDAEGVKAPAACVLRRHGAAESPLSPAQRRLWFLHSLDPSSHAYTLCGALRLQGSLDPAALEEALCGVVARHEALRTSFESRDGEPRQIVRPVVPVLLERRRGEHGTPSEEAARAAQALMSDAWSLGEGPLLRAALVELSSSDRLLVVAMHHMVADGWSIGVLLRDLSALYEARLTGAPPDLPELPVQYPDFAAWQEDSRRLPDRANSLSWWRSRLTGAPERLDLPVDHPTGTAAGRRAALRRFRLEPGLIAALRTIGRREGATLFMTLLAAFQTLLHRLAGQEDFLLGTPIAGRHRSELQDLVGFFVNTLVLRADVSGDPTFGELLARVRRASLEAFAHQDLPFEEIVEALRPVRRTGETPLFQVMFSLQDASPRTLRFARLAAQEMEIDIPAAKFDLSFDLRETEVGLSGTVEFDADRFAEETIARWIGHFRILLESIVADPEAHVSELRLLSAEHEHRIDAVNATRRELPPEACVHRWIEAQAERTPDAVAVESEAGGLTYRELDERANQLAHLLRRRGVGPDRIVAIYMERSLEMVASILAVHKAGGAYLPLDPTYPHARTGVVLRDARATLLLTQPHLEREAVWDTAPVLVLDPGWTQVDSEDRHPLLDGARRDNLAYLLYTSGSTGRPKGVMISHGALANHMLWMAEAFPLDASDTVLQRTSPSFDASIWEFFAPLIAGARLLMAPPGGLHDAAFLIDIIRRHEVTTLQLVPSLLALLLEEPSVRSCTCLKRVFCGGESLPARLRDRFFALLSAELHNLYGPTEATIDATCWSCRRQEAHPAVPIGAPIGNLRGYVLDRGMHRVPEGAAGELCLAGAGLARGYLGDPSLTAERFVPDPFALEPGGRMYRTGDVARLSEGAFEFLGRKDHQVKLRGLRIETGEIESVLTEHPDVREAVVTLAQAGADDGAPRGPELAAYLVSRAGAEISADELTEFLAARLPRFMIPASFQALSVFPLTPNGKIDRRALPAPPARSSTAEFAAPAGEVEEILAAIWSQLLPVERVGRDDNFFDLGGHSLLAMRVMARLRTFLHVELPVRALFEAPTLKTLAARIEERRSAQPPITPAGTEAVPRQVERTAPLSPSQRRLWFLHEMDPASHNYTLCGAVRLRGALDVAALSDSFSGVVARHESLRTVFVNEAGEPRQIVREASPVVLRRVQGGAETVLEQAAHVAHDLVRAPWNLAEGPLMRAALVEISSAEHALVVVMHHIITDGWSSGVLLRDLSALYGARVSGTAPLLEDLPIQYVDYAAWLSDCRLDSERNDGLSHWKRRLAGAPHHLDLPALGVGPQVSRRGALLRWLLPRELSGSLKSLGRSQGATLYMTLLAALQVLISRSTGQEDFLIGSPVAGRGRVELQNLIGFFVNTLILRADLSGDPTFRELLDRVRDTTLEAFAHQDVSVERIVDTLRPERQASKTPMFQLLFALQNAGDDELRLTGLEVEELEIDLPTAKFDLSFDVRETDGKLAGVIEFDVDRFEEETIQRLVEHYQVLLKAVVANPDAPVSQLPLLTPGERQQILEEWSGRKDLATSGALIHERFARQAAAAPERIAAVFDERRVTYGEIHARSGGLAARLLELGNGGESRVGLCVDRSPELLVGILAVLKAGAAFVPLDPEQPSERLAAMVEDAGVRVVLSTKARAPLVAATGCTMVSLEERIDAVPPSSRISPESLAYVIYTSGTTGRPKGVMVTHGSLAAAYDAWDRLYRLEEIGSHLQMAALGFDVCIGDIVRALCSGGTLVFCERDRLLEPARVLEMIQREKVEFGEFVPAVARLLADCARDRGVRLDSLRIAVVGADVWTSAEIEPFRSAFGSDTRLANSYGVTEATIDSTCWFVGDGSRLPGSPPIGRPLSHTTIYLLDGRFRPVPPGVFGEIYLGGPAVARGYLGRPDLTAERFVPDPFGPPGARLYRTGDRAWYLHDGRIVFAGRGDDQVKIRGQRIEPAEVEAALASQGEVAACAVVARPDPGGILRLAAYVVPRRRETFDPEHLRRQLGERLPAAMIPSAIVPLEALPLSANGKVDRHRLPEPEWTISHVYEPPAGPVETAIATAFQEVLRLERVGAGDDFFALGGHSLLATQVVSRIRSALGLEVPLRMIFESPTVRALAARTSALGPTGVPPRLLPAPPEERRLPSYSQRRLWFLHRLDPDSPAYNLPSSILLRGTLDAGALERALTELVRRQETMRTRFVEGPEGPELAIDPPGPLALDFEDLSGLEESERSEAIRRLTRTEARRPFDLARDRVLRVRLLRLRELEHLLLITMHHIVADDWSTAVLIHELGALYLSFVSAVPSPLKEIAIQYADWAAWQRRWLEAGEMERQLAWWRSELDGAETLSLPSDLPRSNRPTHAGASLPIHLPADRRDGCERLAREEGATLTMVLLAAYAATLGRWSGQKDFALAMPVANRRAVEAEALIGFFVNTLPVRVRLRGESLTFRALIRRMRESCLGAYANQDVPFERIVEALQPERYLGRNPIVQTLFALQNAPVGEVALPGLDLSYEEPHTGVTRFEVELLLSESAAGLEGILNYSTELFDSDRMRRFVEDLHQLLEAGLADPDRTLGDLQTLGSDQRRQLLHAWNAPRVSYGDPLLAHAPFERHARLTPEATAALFNGERLAYGELNDRANRLARFLRKRGVGCEDLVPVCIERSFDMLVALLGVMKAGAAYVPLDPEYPADRIALILEDVEAGVVLTQASLEGRLPSGTGTVIRLDADWMAIAPEEDAELEGVSPDALAYAVYTSGSTGRPKGVAMSHRAIANLLSFQRRDSEAAGAGRTLQFASLSFDVSFQEIFSTLAAGGSLVLVDETERRDTPRLLRRIEEEGVERLFLPFVALNQLAETAAEEDLYPESLREIDTAGEQLKITPALRTFFERLPACRLVNHYGPSETHLVTTFPLEGDPSTWSALPAIGRPIPNAPVYLLDGRGRLVPAGVPGEVCVGGAGLARGYHARADLTAECFIPDPFSEEPGARLYRTGDLARFRADGNLEFLGRIDLQVKVRGYRIEPGEIEVALTRHPAVRQAVVTSHEHGGGKRLAAYVVRQEGALATPAELKDHLARTLPEYMVPAALVLLEKLPLTPNGKVNRQVLPDPDWGAASAYVKPRTPQEEVVCGIFAEVLGLSRVGATDNFFDLGGHSLLATRVLSRVRRSFGVEMPLRGLFESPTPAGIAASAARSHGSPAPPAIRPASGPRRNLLSYAQRRLWFLHRLEPGSAAYNLPALVRLEGDLDLEALSRALSEIVRRHESLRTRFVEGPEGPEQVIDPPLALRLDPEVLPDEEEARIAARRLLSEEAALPFDLAKGPVLRARLLRLDARSHLLSVVVHHISGDGWSMGVLLRELGILYGAFAEGRESPLPEPEIQYADWAAWQRDWLEQGELDRQVAHWRSSLQGAPAALDLPTDRARPATASWSGETLHVALPAGLRDRLSRLARTEGVTLQMALLAGYAWTLMRHAGQREIVVGTPVANRRATEAEGLVGFFVNTLAVRIDGGGDTLTLRGLLARVREASLSAYVNQDVPFERVVEELHPERALNRAPLFQTAFALQSPYLPEVELPGLKMSPFEIESHTAKFDLMLILGETEDAFEGALEYNTGLFDRQTIEAMFARMERLLEAALAAPEAPLSTLSLLAPGERVELVTEYSTPSRTNPGELLLHELFQRQAVRTPDAPALAIGEETLRYAELDERANRLALRLRKLGIGPESRVAILLDRSIEAVVALLAVLKAGGAYVPLETGQPEARLRWVIEDCGAALVVTDSRLAERVIDMSTPLLRIDRDEPEASDNPASCPAPTTTPANLAYVIYTSGSTGTPKGVGIEHRQIAGYVAAAIERLAIAPGWRFGLVSTLAADLGHTALFPCLATGGCLCLLPPDLSFDPDGAADYFAEHPVDCMKIVPSHLQALLGASHPERILPRRLLVLGGEATPGTLLTKLRELAPDCRVANHYGPTEATVGAVAGFPDPADAARSGAPLGRALSNARAYLLDERLQPVPVGMPGELFVGGGGVARGYLGAAALTAERFVPDPFASRPGARMYRTGDRARRLRDGRLEFLGRSDGQLKIRGNRVEPREAEAALRNHPDVREAAVIARADPLGGAQLVAYVVPQPRVSATIQGLKRRQLPNGMAVAELNRNETDYIYREIFELRAYTRHGITLRDSDTIVDVGANIGLFSLFASLARPQARILACEPNPHLQPILRANLSLFAPTAAAFEVGLAQRERRAAFTFFPGFSLFSGLYADAEVEKRVVKSFLENQARSGAAGAARLAQEADALLEERFAGVTLEVPLRTLSDLMAEQRIERIDLLKINAEKAELDVLRGVGEEDWARIDQAVLEVDLGKHLEPIVSLLEDRGFQVHVDQDPFLERTDLRYVYAARRGSGRTLTPGAPCSLALPLVQEPLLTAQALRDHLARWLPDPLLPSAWAFLESLPLTANGKLDRSRLPEPEDRQRPYQAPRGEIERAVAEIWSEVLQRERVGAHDNFFDLGGHSLLLARVHANLRDKLKAEISIVELFRFPTVASLAARLADGAAASDAAAGDRQRGARRRAAARARTKSRATPTQAGP